MRHLWIALALVALTHSAASADALDQGRAREAAFDFEGAYAIYAPAARLDTTSYELSWRLAKAAGDRGQRYEFDRQKDRAEAAYEEAVRAARRAVRLAPDGWEGHSLLAANLGRFALFAGGKTKIQLSREVKAEADRALALRPEDDRAVHVLARWNRTLARLNLLERAAAKVVYGGLPEGASMNNAVTLFEHAIALAPGSANHRLELGRTYLALGLKDKARAELEAAIAAPKTSAFDAEYRSEAQILLRQTH
jgi:tetratricopeptide (TPR) repeat protein